MSQESAFFIVAQGCMLKLIQEPAWKPVPGTSRHMLTQRPGHAKELVQQHITQVRWPSNVFNSVQTNQ